jgi:hypothetical protein
LIASGDIHYAPPTYQPFDDGLVFPLQKLPDLGSGFSSSAAEQIPIILEGIATARQEANYPSILGAHGGMTNPQLFAWNVALNTFNQTGRSLAYLMESHPVSWEMSIAPVAGQTFNGAYNVDTSPLEIEMGIDLQAPSSP